MKLCPLYLFACLLIGHRATAVRTGNPIQKIIELITEFQGKLVRDGETEQKAYDEYFEWCDDASKDKNFELKSAQMKAEKLASTIEKATSDIEDSSVKIEELSASTSTDEADLKAATEIREKEQADFSAEEKELMESVDMLGRAIGVLEKELGGSAFLQQKLKDPNIVNLIQTLNTIIDAASFGSHDKQKLLALVQSGREDDMDKEEAAYGAPDPDSYKSKSGGIVDTLEDMKDKAETQLAEARKAEMTAKQNYMMLKLTLEDKISAEKQEMDESKATKAEAEETKAIADGEFSSTKKELALSAKDLQTIQMDCMEKAQDHEITVKGRKAELKALAVTKKIIQAAALTQSGSAPNDEDDDNDDAPALLQVASSSRMFTKARMHQAGIKAAALIKKLAKQQHSTAMAQLASRIEATVRFSGHMGEDPFAKVKGLINNMLAKLLKEAQAEAEEKAYCDSEMGKTEKQRDLLTEENEDFTAKIDAAISSSSRLKDEVKELQGELHELAKTQGDMDKARADAHAAFVISSTDIKKGLDALRKALKVLREYYAKDAEDGAELLQSDDDGSKFDALMQQPAPPEKHKKSQGAGDSIIAMLEVAESDFAKNLAEEEAEEEAAQAEFDQLTQENKITKATKEQDVKYKTKEYKALDKSVVELTSDRANVQQELDAVLEYYDKLKEKCVAKPESYEERKKRREAEIAGLKEALAILEGEAVFMQQGAPIQAHDA